MEIEKNYYKCHDECFILEHRMSISTCLYVFLFLNSICLADKCFLWHSVKRLQPGMRIFKTVLNQDKYIYFFSFLAFFSDLRTLL